MLIEHIRKDRYQDAINRHKSIYFYINRHEQNFTLDIDSDKWHNKIFIALLDSLLALTNTCQDWQSILFFLLSHTFSSFSHCSLLCSLFLYIYINMFQIYTHISSFSIRLPHIWDEGSLIATRIIQWNPYSFNGIK